jgi:glutathione S-transferase
VPTLKDGDFVINESLAIMSYLDRKISRAAALRQNSRGSGLDLAGDLRM